MSESKPWSDGWIDDQIATLPDDRIWDMYEYFRAGALMAFEEAARLSPGCGSPTTLRAAIRARAREVAGD